MVIPGSLQKREDTISPAKALPRFVKSVISEILAPDRNLLRQAAVILLIAVLIAGYDLTGYSSDTYLMFVLLAVVPQIIGHSSLNWSLRFVSATLVTIAVLGEPVVATALAYIILNESPTLMEIAGGILILSGIVIAFRKNRSQFTEK